MRWNIPHEFYTDTIGKSVYGGQCSQYFNGFSADQGCAQIPNEWAKDIWNQRYSNGVLDYYDEVPINNLIDGDWVIYGNCPATPDSHIGMFRKDNGDGTFVCLQQNANYQKIVTQDDMPYSGLIGALRLKMWNTKPKGNYILANAHIQGIGWIGQVPAGKICGTTGRSLRMEALNIDSNIKIKAKAHLQDIGDVDYGVISKNTIIGTTGESRRMEALCLEGNFSYRVHIQNLGWTDWHKADGTWLGTKGKSLRLEAIEIKMD